MNHKIVGLGLLRLGLVYALAGKHLAESLVIVESRHVLFMVANAEQTSYAKEVPTAG